MPNDTPIIQCKRCGQKNRIAAHMPDRVPICGKCRTALIPTPVKARSNLGRTLIAHTKKHLAWIILLGIISVGIYASSRPLPKHTTPPVRRPIEYFPHPQQPLPYSGSVRRFNSAEAVAPFEIKAPTGSHYLLKLVNAYNDLPVLTVFVRSGTTVEVDVPLGKYEVRYASGKIWYGENYLFGPDTSYSKADKELDFRDDGYRVSGFTITLYNVAHGNLRTSSIKASEF